MTKITKNLAENIGAYLKTLDSVSKVKGGFEKDRVGRGFHQAGWNVFVKKSKVPISIFIMDSAEGNFDGKYQLWVQIEEHTDIFEGSSEEPYTNISFSVGELKEQIKYYYEQLKSSLEELRQCTACLKFTNIEKKKITGMQKSVLICGECFKVLEHAKILQKNLKSYKTKK